MSNYVFITTTPEKKGIAYPIHDQLSIDIFIQDNRHSDLYRTINLFKEPTNRTQSNIGLLVNLVIDIEVINHAYDITRHEAIKLVDKLKNDFGQAIPEPRKILHSGRGLHVHFNITPSTEIFKYQLVLKSLQYAIDQLLIKYDPLSEAKHDPKVNYWSLIRLEDSYNTKAGVYVTPIYSSETTYDLDTLIEGYIPALNNIKTNNPQAIEYEHQKAFRTYTKQFKGYNTRFTKDTLRLGMISDLETLQRLRNDHMALTQGLYKYLGNEGNRNVLLFYYGLYVKYYYQDTKIILDKMTAYNNNFRTEPLSKPELLRTYQSVISKNYATPKTSTIINNVGITDHEMKHLKIIMDKDHKRKRNVVKVAKSKRKAAQFKKQDKNKLIDQVIELHTQGISYREIQRLVGVSLGTIHNYIKLTDDNQYKPLDQLNIECSKNG